MGNGLIWQINAEGKIEYLKILRSSLTPQDWITNTLLEKRHLLGILKQDLII